VTNSNRRYFLIHTDENQLSLNKILLQGVLDDISSPDKCLQFVRYLYTKFDPSWNSETYVRNEQTEHEHFKNHLEDQITQSDQFLLLLIQDEALRCAYNFESMKALELYTTFRDLMQKVNRTHIWTMQKFGREIKKVPGVISKTHQYFRSYTLDFDLIREYLISQKLLE
jgi:hypothetical protein